MIRKDKNIQWSPSKAGPTIIERESSGQGFIINNYVGYIWDSVSVHYKGIRVSSKRGSTVVLARQNRTTSTATQTEE